MEQNKKMGLISAILLGINGIVGSGIFLLPGKVYTAVGSNSLVVYVLATLLVLSILVCFAEAGGLFNKNGGAYLYAKEAFGEFVGFEVGLMSWVVRIISWSALSVAFATAIGVFWPEAATTYKNLIASALVIILSINSIFGVKKIEIINNISTVGKLVPLIIFIVVGIFFVKPENVFVSGGPALTTSNAAAGIILIFYAFTGFESFVVATGEIENPKKNMPIALIVTMAIVAVIYILIQIVCVGVLGANLADNSAPIAEASNVFLGGYGKVFIGIASLISILGINIGSSLVTPRCGSSLAEDGLLPRAIAKTNKYGSPYIAIIISACLCIPLIMSGGFEQLAVMSVVARFAQYLPTCISILVLRKRSDLQSTFKVPFGPVIPIIAVVCSLWLLQQAWIQDIGAPIYQNRVLIGLGALVVIVPIYFIMKKVNSKEKEQQIENVQ
ncbi:MAG: APC family permease [Intestinibacter sp.]|uniref:APC family permease n=1 Tax=Intestinibacter sp. TaxID=1965304 RepID=UPI003F18505F